MDNLTDATSLKNLFPHLLAKQIEHGVKICGKSLDDAYGPGIGRVSTARNYDGFQEEARGQRCQNMTQYSTVHSAGYRQKDNPEATANSRVDDNENEYTW